MAGKEIEAILTLNSSGFTSGLNKSIESLTKFATDIGKINGNIATLESTLASLSRVLGDSKAHLTALNNAVKGLEDFNKFATAINKTANALKVLSDDSLNADQSINILNSVFKAWGDTLNGTEVKIKGVINTLEQMKGGSSQTVNSVKQMENEFNKASQDLLKFAESGLESFNSVKSGINQLKSAFDSQYMQMDKVNAKYIEAREYATLYRENLMQLALGVERFNAIETNHALKEKEVSTATNQASSSMQRYSSASRTATASTQAQTSATNGLKNAFSSLKMAGSLVASMMVWNFASSMIEATRETVNAKSEMEGYFQMLHFSQGEIDSFNQALDRTVQQFQRVNKYSLGETISSIGVEFNLSTKEMEKAMKVTSMITSEYLRAGRNANEASLAVKDVLQGQFQRLSRETGVKGEQLKEAGWSGDTNDVLGLMEALEKVAMSRNWDVFAEKANSLNDIVTILQNRFGEWSAEMVNVVQPSIVSAFNTIMSVGSAFGSIMGGIWEWLNSDGILQSIIKWTGLATAITGVVSAMIVYRTGANLVQVAQMGLRGTIGATILGLEAQTVAEVGLRNATVSRLTSLDAEIVKEMGVKNAIATKVLGLNAEKVAQFGLKGAIDETILSKKLEELANTGISNSNKAVIMSELQTQLEKRGTLATIMAKIAGVNMETFAERGLIVALAQRIATSPLYIGALEAEEVAELSTAEASMLLATSLAPLIAIFVGLAVAVYSVVKPLQDASAEMKNFNDVVNNSQSIMDDAYATQKQYREETQRLTAERDKLTKGTKEYKRVQDQLTTATKNYNNAQKLVQANMKAVNLAQNSRDYYDNTKIKLARESTLALADSYIKAGFSATEASEMASRYYRDAEKGAKQLKNAIQMISLEEGKRQARTDTMLGYLSKYNVPKEKVKELVGNLQDAHDKISEGLDKFMTSDDLMERIGGWFEIQQGRFEAWWTEFNALFEVRDWAGMRDKLIEGLRYVLSGFGAFDWIGELDKILKEKGLVGAIMDALFGEGDSDGIVDYITDWGNKMIIQPIASWLSWFMKDPIKHFNQTAESFSLALAKFLFGSDTTLSVADMIEIWFNDSVIRPINSWLSWFMEDPIAHFDQTAESFSLALAKFLFGEDTDTSLAGMIQEWFNNTFILPFTSFDWGSLVSTYITTPFATWLYNGIMSIPLVSTILQLFGLVNGDNTGASSKGNLIATALKNALQNVIYSIPIVGDLLSIIAKIVGVYADARSKGKSVGDSIKEGVKAGINAISNLIVQEFMDALNGIGKLGKQAYETAKNWAKQLWDGVNAILQRASPGFFHDQIQLEFGTDIPNAISESGATAYSTAQTYAQQMYDGMSSVDNGFGLGTVVDDYQTDAQTVSMYSQMMGMDTTMAFNDMSLAVNDTTMQMSTNVATSYSTMQQKQASLLQNMKTSNTSAYNEMYQKSNQSLIQMRDSTTNITNQMISAWGHMRTQLVATADALRSESTAHFNQLSNHIGSFYRKIQNPSSWGAGSPSSPQTRGARNSKVGKAFVNTITGRHGAGGNGTTGRYSPYRNNNTTMSLRQLKRMICPNGDCDGLFDGLDMSQVVNVAEFLSSIEGEHGFGWTGWNKTHYQYIRQKSNQWDMKSPILNVKGGIPTNAQFKVGEFENGRPQISFGAFQSMAESLFSAVPYAFYYDSDKYGSWQNALAHGECNCSDGADAIIAFAQTCGFSGYKQHGTWVDPDGSTYGHFYAVINGKKMDTTGWQQRRSWSAGSPSTSTKTPPNNKEVHIHIDMSNSTNYGMDNIEERIEEGVKKGLREQFNNPTTVVI